MEMPNQEVIEQAIILLAESCQADMAVLFVAEPTQDAIDRMIAADTAWREFSAAHPEIEQYVDWKELQGD
ncbi:hypothetical protein EBOKLHFM_00060 [Klebsiella phage KP13-26]|nr:hypothetical protein EBOKLHFM_00060 [Klebsiella phage KP13-26]